MPPDFPTGEANSSLELISNLSKGQYVEAHSLLTERLKAEKTVDQLADDWKTLSKRIGDFKKVEAFTTEASSDFTTVALKCSFKNGKTTIVVHVKPDSHIDEIAYGS